MPMPAACEPPTKQAAVAVRAHAGSAQSSPADSDAWSPLKQIMAAPTRVHLLPLLEHNTQVIYAKFGV